MTRIQSRFGRIRTWAVGHKKTSFAAALLALLSLTGIYRTFAKTTIPPQYVLGSAERSTIISSLSGSGQVSATNQLDIKAEVSSRVLSVLVKPGTSVQAGTVIARLDASDAIKAVRDAETSLETARLSLDKLLAPASGLTLTQAQHALVSAEEDKTSAEEDLEKTYRTGYDDATNAFLDLPALMSGLQELVTGTAASSNGIQTNLDFYKDSTVSFDPRASSYATAALNDYREARNAYDAAFTSFQNTSRSGSPNDLQKLIEGTHSSLQLIARAIKSTNALVQLYQDQQEIHNLDVAPEASIHLKDLASYTGTATSHLARLLSDSSSIRSSVERIASATRTIEERSEALQEKQAGADELDIRSAKITVRQREDALGDARKNLTKYTIRAPFAGVIASVNLKQHDTTGSGVAATVITHQRIVELSLNEVDIAKVHTGDKATLTFDALENLSLTGKVSEVGTLGTVSQGVVSYPVKIAFDTQDSRVRPGMTVNASIITNIKNDVIGVPGSAVKTNNGSSYVLGFNPPLEAEKGATVTAASEPIQIPVVIGISDDTTTEIVSGLEEGTQIVTRALTTTTQSQTSAPSATSLLGGNRATGGAVRFTR